MPKSNWKMSSLDIAELVELRDQLDRALKAKIESEEGEIRSRLDELSLFQPKSGASGRKSAVPRAAARTNPLKGRKVMPKYRGPQGETWSGRGLPPRWLTELEAKGKKRETFLIKPAE
jgi:DNA-binding protein H-NS